MHINWESKFIVVVLRKIMADTSEVHRKRIWNSKVNCGQVRNLEVKCHYHSPTEPIEAQYHKIIFKKITQPPLREAYCTACKINKKTHNYTHLNKNKWTFYKHAGRKKAIYKAKQVGPKFIVFSRKMVTQKCYSWLSYRFTYLSKYSA